MEKATTFGYEYPVYNPAFARADNETLYDALCGPTAPIDAGLDELSNRMRPIVLGTARPYLNALSWTFDDALGEALILIWEIVRKRSYKSKSVPFHCFFSRCWELHLNRTFKQAVTKNPVMLGNCRVGTVNDKPIKVCGYGWHDKAEEYRQKDREKSKRRRDQQREKNGPQPRKPRRPAMSKEEAREKARVRFAEKFAAMTPDEKRAAYDRANELSRARRAAETPEEKAARRAKYAAYARERRARLAAGA